MIGIFIFIIWFLLLVFSFRVRKDPFSPLKLYLLNIIVFWGAIFYKEYDDVVYFYFLLILLFGVIIGFKEDNAKNVFKYGYLRIPNRSKIWLRLWIVSLVPVISQIVLIHKMGGINGYLMSISLRVVEWQGMGLYILLTKLILVINLIYFVLIVKVKKVTKVEFLLFVMNLLVFIAIALLSGSRSTLLVNFILMFIIYYYYVKKISLYKFGILGGFALIAALVLGVVRNQFSFSDNTFDSGLNESMSLKDLETANFEYGLFPLQVIMDQEVINSYKYGSTYLTAFSNLIPRSIWPEKPPTGGVIFTNEYHNIHGGYSNYSTGFIVEGILNFGFFFGPFIAFLLLYIIYLVFFNYYGKATKFKNLQAGLIYFTVVPNLLYFLPTFLHGEFTTVIHSILLNKVLLIILVVKLVIPKRVEYDIEN